MKKLLALLLALTMLFALAACTGGNEDNPTDAPTDAPTDGPTEPPTEPPTNPPADSSDNGGEQTGIPADFVPTPAKYGRDEFVSLLKEHVDGMTPDKNSHYTEGFDPEQENGWKYTYYIKDFVEEHELNLFLHKTNNAEGKQANGWIVVDKFAYEYIDKTTYSVSMFYTVSCETLEEVIYNARTDALRVALIYGLEPTQMAFYTNVKNKKTDVYLGDNDFAKLVSGEYGVIYGNLTAAPACGDSSKLEIDVNKTADGKFEYVFVLRIQITE